MPANAHPRMPAARFSVLSALLLHLRLLWQVAAGLSICCALLTVLQAGAAVLAMVTSGRLIGALTAAVGTAGSADQSGVWGWLLLTAGAFLAGPLFAAAAGGIAELINARYLSGYQDLLLDTTVAPYTVEDLQTPAGAATLSRASGALQHWLFLRGVGGVWGSLANYLIGLGAAVIVAGWRLWPAAVLLLGWLLLGWVTARWRSIVFDDSTDRSLPLRHRASYLRQLLVGRSSAKEIRLFGLADWITDGYRQLSQRAMQMIMSRRGDGIRRTLPALLLVLVLYAAVFAMLIADIAAGRVSVAAVATLVQALVGISAFGRQDDDETSTARTATELARLVTFRRSLRLPPLARSVAPPVAHLGSGAAVVDLRGVGFSYPGTSRPVLAGLDLRIEAGECVAVVGANGVGKSTLLALLCGLWRPDTGTIAIDGLDPGRDHRARSRIAPIFQTFLRLPLSAEDNLAAGSGWRPGIDYRVAAADGGADQVLAKLTGGAQTVLSAEFTGGTDLSGGQWQRIALARALTAVEAGAGLLALDEPTAALDVRAEAALFDAVLRRTADTSTLLITHRLSSVRHADRIVVLGEQNGAAGARVIENGPHQDLIRRGGAYAEMFRLQAARFQEAQ